jgi:hypothetical protein
VLLNRTKLLSYVGQEEAPVVIMCPECNGVYHFASLWNTIQHRSTEVVCVCGNVVLVPKLSDAAPLEREVEIPWSKLAVLALSVSPLLDVLGSLADLVAA